MSDHPGAPPDPTRGPAGPDPASEPHGPFDPPAHTGVVRGIAVVAVFVVIGALLLPSATRPPLAVTSSHATSTTTAPSGSTTTTTKSKATTSSTTTPTILPRASAVHVLVANSTNTAGVAAATSAYLRTRGFATLTAVNATAHPSTSQVYAGAGEQSAAALVAEALGLSASTIQPASAVAPVANTTGATVVVVLGPDLAARFAPSTPPTP